jgi:cytochrome c oxidase subunit 1
MMGAGTLGVSRRHWDMAFSGAALAYEWPGAAYLMMGLVGIAGIAAIVGGAIYIYVTVGSLLWGKKLESGPQPAALHADPVRRARRGGAGTYGSMGFAARAPSCWRWCSWWPSSCTTSSTGSTCRSSGA